MDNRTLIRAEALLAEARSMMETLMNKLQEDFNEKDEKWQESDAGETARGAD